MALKVTEAFFKDKYHPKLPGSKGFEAHQDATIWEGNVWNEKLHYSLYYA